MAAPKRPRDPNQLAKSIVGIATGQVEDREPDSGKDPAAAAQGRKGGQRRAELLTAHDRQEIARKAAKTRWASKKETSAVRGKKEHQ
jgi:hypothetical protein